MTQNETNKPSKGLGKIYWRDILQSLYYGSIPQIFAIIAFLSESIIAENPHFPTWVEWLPYVKATAGVMGSIIVGKFGINNIGQILKKDKDVVKIDVDTLENLENNQIVK